MVDNRDVPRFLDPCLDDAASIAAMRKRFRNDGAVLVAAALSSAGIDRLRSETAGRWVRSNIPDRSSCDIITRTSSHPEISAFVRSVTSAAPIGGTSMRFSRGGYTLLHDGVVATNKSRVVAFLVLDPWDASWGGDLVWTVDGETVLRLPPMENTLYIVRETAGMRRFVKYVNHRAGARSFRIIAVR